MARLLSPRKHGFDAWKPPALALVKAKARFSHVSAVLVSAAMCLGKDEFFKKFGGHSTVEEFLNDVNPRRDSLFAGGRKLPTAVALYCMKAAADVANIQNNGLMDAKAKFDQQTLVLQNLFLFDEVVNFHKGNSQELVDVVLTLIHTMALWTDPRGALLGPNTMTGSNQKFERELSVMGEMYESEPTTQEVDDEDSDKIIGNMQDAAKSVLNAGKTLVRAFLGTTSPAPPPPQDWFAESLQDVVNILQYLVWLCAMMYVCRIWLDALFTEFSTDSDVFKKEWFARKSTNYDTAGVIYVFVMMHWSGTQNMMLFAMYVGMLSLHLAHAWPRIVFLHSKSSEVVQECWIEWATANLTTFSKDECDNQHIATREFMHLIYYWMAGAIGVMFCVDMATVVLLFYRNKNVSCPADVVFHKALCSQACTEYLFLQHVHQVHKLVWLKHTVNVIIFLGLLCMTTVPEFQKKTTKTSALSLLGYRLVCFCVCCSEFFVLYYHGCDNYTSDVIGATYVEVRRVYQYVFVFQSLAYGYGMVRPDTNILFAGKRPTVGDIGLVARNT